MDPLSYDEIYDKFATLLEHVKLTLLSCKAKRMTESTIATLSPYYVSLSMIANNADEHTLYLVMALVHDKNTSRCEYLYMIPTYNEWLITPLNKKDCNLLSYDLSTLKLTPSYELMQHEENRMRFAALQPILDNIYESVKTIPLPSI